MFNTLRIIFQKMKMKVDRKVNIVNVMLFAKTRIIVAEAITITAL